MPSLLKNRSIRILLLSCLLSLFSCGAYNFTGGDVGTAETFQVNYFQNYASQSPGSTFDPGLDREFTLALQDLILNQTSLDLVSAEGDLLFEGEIVEYRVTPMSATAEQRAAQNRLSISVNVRFFNRTKEDADFERRFSHFYDYDAASQLSTVRDEAHQVIFERINQDIFQAALADW
ncbi:LptE family protein [Zeaxanthinibacter enoshimensis]|uniref:Lipopolysaccharide assembly protein n=1 Tax=Zeaxanthinibacter enoshimensis TaxID=392009 RepID=A0A4R6TSN9_9FLAO|nr:LptE family protein [Zeaxanthinibacter enoshimensis]TDQ33337.1 lipopolysaccharide assembly protein [Zeaxanthinibacter enoshimensis]